MTRTTLLLLGRSIRKVIADFLVLSFLGIAAFAAFGASNSFSAAHDSRNESQLYEASKRGDLAKVRELVELNGALVNQRLGDFSSTPLMIAALFGNSEVVKYLLSKGSDVNAVNKLSSTALGDAAINGNPEIIEAIIARGASANVHDSNGTTPLMQAAFKGKIGAVKLLLEKGRANVDAVDKKDHTAIMMAARGGHLGIVELLITYGANVNARAARDLGGVPIIEAVAGGNIDVIELLLRYRADVDASIDNGYTPLMVAAEQGSDEAVRLLLKHGANPNKALKDGRTALMLSREAGHASITKLLIDGGANVDSLSDSSAESALTGRIAVPQRCIDYLEELEIARDVRDQCRLQSDPYVAYSCVLLSKERVDSASWALDMCLMQED